MGKNILDKYLVDRSANGLYRDNGRNYLDTDYIPKELPHRDKEINQLAGVVAPAFKGSLPLNILMYGKTGTGKTAVALSVKKAIEQKNTELEEIPKKPLPVNCFYINCMINTSPYSVLANITNNFKAEGEEVPYTGWSIDKIYGELLGVLHGMNIIILDEVDKLVSKNKDQGNQLLYALTNINSESDKGKISIIGISNDLTYTSSLEQKVLGRIRGEQFVFQAYDSTQLNDILKERIELAFYPNTVGDGALALCAALATQKDGDARYALKLLRKAGDIAEHNEAVTVLTDHVKQAGKLLKKYAIRSGVEKLTEPQKILLSALIINRNQVLTTGEVYEEYAHLCDTLRTTRLTSRRITDFISMFDEAGLINATLCSLGRGKGRTRKIWLSDKASLEETIGGILDSSDKKTCLDNGTRKKLREMLEKHIKYMVIPD